MSEYLEKSGGRGYVERTKDEFDALLVERLKFREIRIEGTTEIVYQRDGRRGDYAVRVYSSIQPGINRTRDCGNDAIRVLMVDLRTGFPKKIMGEKRNAKTGTRINRTKGAMNNLERRVKQYLNMGTEKYTCPVCAGLMAVRTRKSDSNKFLSCTEKVGEGWCNGTRPAPEWIK